MIGRAEEALWRDGEWKMIFEYLALPGSATCLISTGYFGAIYPIPLFSLTFIHTHS
jgi:hypothetical protein